MRRWLLPALIALSTAAGGPLALAQETAAPAAGDVARAQALTAFQRDLVSVLALRATAQPLLGAALLARPLTGQPATTQFHTLVNRAVAAGDSGPAEQWARLADCDAQAMDCPNTTALRKLTETDADNAAVWLLKLDTDHRDMKSKAVRADLAKAAAASRYDDYAGASLTALAAVVDSLPPPPATQGAGGVPGTEALIVLGNAHAQVRPVLPVVARLCASDDAAIKADCLRLGKRLAWGSSPLARSLGLHLITTLDTDATARATAQRDARDLAWQVQNHAQLALRAPDDAALAGQILATAKAGGTEMAQMLTLLRARGVSPTAPGSWQPAAAATASTPSP